MKIRGDFHQTMYSLATSAPFNLFVVAVVIVNTVQMILLTSAYQQIMHGLHAVPQRYLCCTRGVLGNGEDWDPMGPMGFPWEWE